MTLLAIWFCGNRSMAKGASEDRLAHLSMCWRRTPGSPDIAFRQRWMTGLAGERKPWGSNEVDLVVVVVVVAAAAAAVAVAVAVVVVVGLWVSRSVGLLVGWFRFACCGCS